MFSKKNNEGNNI